MLRKVEQVAFTDSTVLILGETGTGKELIARAVHNLSLRKARPLIRVSCGAIPTNLIESELFGHEKGSFTGATTRRIGRFELADGGTIFLDEVGELPMDAQAKLLRVLQEREFERVGGNRVFKTNVRVIAATNRDLWAAVNVGSFRSDLLYRLNVFPIEVPPLRARTSDIPLLVRSFADKCSTKLGKHLSDIPQQTMDRLVTYAWPGNVRELANIIERAAILSPGPLLQIDEGLFQSNMTAEPDAAGTLEEIERSYVLRVLQETDWVIEGKQGAATKLGLHPNTLRSRMKKLGLKKPRSTN